MELIDSDYVKRKLPTTQTKPLLKWTIGWFFVWINLFVVVINLYIDSFDFTIDLIKEFVIWPTLIFSLSLLIATSIVLRFSHRWLHALLLSMSITFIYGAILFSVIFIQSYWSEFTITVEARFFIQIMRLIFSLGSVLLFLRFAGKLNWRKAIIIDSIIFAIVILYHLIDFIIRYNM